MMMRKPDQTNHSHTLKLQQKYWLKDTSEEKLLALGAMCAEKVVDHNHYYDTSTFELAASETWLSQKNNQWQLIIGKRNGNAHKAKTSLDMKGLKNSMDQRLGSIANAEKSEHGECSLVNSNSINDPRAKNSPENSKDHYDQPMSRAKQHSNEASPTKLPTNLTAEPGCTYQELTNEREILTFLASVLHTAVTDEDRNSMPMKEFLQLAGINYYASLDTVRKVTYKLLNTCTVTIQTDKESSMKAAVISVDADIQNITGGFDEIEKLANELDFQHLPA